MLPVSTGGTYAEPARSRGIRTAHPAFAASPTGGPSPIASWHDRSSSLAECRIHQSHASCVPTPGQPSADAPAAGHRLLRDRLPPSLHSANDGMPIGCRRSGNHTLPMDVSYIIVQSRCKCHLAVTDTTQGQALPLLPAPTVRPQPDFWSPRYRPTVILGTVGLVGAGLRARFCAFPAGCPRERT